MKEKLIGLITVSALLTSLLLTGGYFAWEQLGSDIYGMMDTGLNLGRALEQRGAGKVPTVDRNIQKNIQRLQKKLTTLRVPGLPKRGRVDFEMIGYVLSKAEAPPPKVEEETEEDFSFSRGEAQIISMTYVSGENRYAVINGKLYKEGELLNNELRIKKIDHSKVLIASMASENWIEVNNPVQEKVEESVEGGETKTSSNKKAEKKSSAPKKPKSKMESITQGLSAIKGYSGALKSVQ